MEIFTIYASSIAQLQDNLINGTNKLSFLSVQIRFLSEHLPRVLKHLTVAPPCLILMIWKWQIALIKHCLLPIGRSWASFVYKMVP